MEFYSAPDIDRLLREILQHVAFEHINPNHITCMRSTGSKSRARARIWSFPRIWQIALSHPPHYVIEVIDKYFDTLSEENKIRVLIHELMHIPKTFSGALRPHKGKYVKINRRSVEKIYKEYKKNSTS